MLPRVGQFYSSHVFTLNHWHEKALANFSPQKLSRFVVICSSESRLSVCTIQKKQYGIVEDQLNPVHILWLSIAVRINCLGLRAGDFTSKVLQLFICIHTAIAVWFQDAKHCNVRLLDLSIFSEIFKGIEIIEFVYQYRCRWFYGLYKFGTTVISPWNCHVFDLHFVRLDFFFYTFFWFCFFRLNLWQLKSSSTALNRPLNFKSAAIVSFGLGSNIAVSLIVIFWFSLNDSRPLILVSAIQSR